MRNEKGIQNKANGPRVISSWIAWTARGATWAGEDSKFGGPSPILHLVHVRCDITDQFFRLPDALTDHNGDR